MRKLKAAAELFEGRHFDREVIILCVRVRFAPDSPLEEAGFELSVPRERGHRFELSLLFMSLKPSAY